MVTCSNLIKKIHEYLILFLNKLNLPLNFKFLSFNREARIRERKVFNEGSDFLLIK